MARKRSKVAGRTTVTTDPASDQPDADRAPAHEPDYEVGYGRPPSHTRFKPGQSGNPKGRTPGSRNFKTLVGDIFEERIEIREGDRIRKMSRLEAIIRVNVQRALKGDPKVFAMVCGLAKQVGYGTEAAAAATDAAEGLDHEAIIAEFLSRSSGGGSDGSGSQGEGA